MAESNATHPVSIEEEPPHEIYANLLTSSKRQRHSRPSLSSTRRVHTHNTLVRQNRAIEASIGRSTEIIPDEDDAENDNCQSNGSQFMDFYRKSCRFSADTTSDREGADRKCNDNKTHTSADSHSGRDFSSTTNRRGNNATNNDKAATSIAQIDNKTTKAERRRIAKRERERKLQMEKRIRFMLRSDISDEYEQLYAGLHR